jgi:hypothetical protein
MSKQGLQEEKRNYFFFLNKGSAFIEDRQKEHSTVLLAIPSQFYLEANVSG